MFPNHLRASDQGFVMGGVNQVTHSERASGEEQNVSHAAVLTYAEWEACMKERVGYNTGSNQAVGGSTYKLSYNETPKGDYQMSKKESSKQVGLFAAMGNRCPMWILHHIKAQMYFHYAHRNTKSTLVSSQLWLV